MPLIVLTNDDGIESPGLAAAVRAALGFGDLRVMAPTRQQTAMGRSFTGDRSSSFSPYALKVDGTVVPAWHCDGSPAWVLRHGLQVLCADRQPDLVLSGINYGENVGSSITASGTLGAAFEAASHGLPALAAALQIDPALFHHHTEQDWAAATHHLRAFIPRLLGCPMPFDVDVLKVDVPEGATADTPWRLCRLSRQPYITNHLDEPHAGSRLGDARLFVRVDHATLEPDSDVHALTVDKVVAVTPLSLDLTSRTDFGELLRRLG